MAAGSIFKKTLDGIKDLFIVEAPPGTVAACLVSQYPRRGASPVKKMAKYSPKTVSVRRNQFIAAWREHAPEATFAGSTLAQFEAETLEPITVRLLMVDAKAHVAGLMRDRSRADAAMSLKLLMVSKAVQGDMAYGPDSNLYTAMGYVASSVRKSGLVRKKAATPVVTPVVIPPATSAA